MISTSENVTYAPTADPAIISSDEPIVAQTTNIQSAIAGMMDIRAGAGFSAPQNTNFTGFQTVLETITQILRSLGALIGVEGVPTDRTTLNPIATIQYNSPTNRPWYEIINEEPDVKIPDLSATKPLLASPEETPQVDSDPPGNGFTLGEPDAISHRTGAPPKKTGDTPKKTAPKKITTGSQITTSGEFLWKPVSDKDQKLAILIPSKLTGKVRSVSIISRDKTKILAKGTYAGVGNGNREHFRFSKAGEKYPDNSIVLITLRDGSTQSVTIRETSQRYTR